MPISNIHGNLVQVNQRGVLILGSPGIGKSKMALDLLDRGHFFIADDLVCLSVETQPTELITPTIETQSSTFDSPSPSYCSSYCSSSATPVIMGSRAEIQARMHIRDLGFINIDQRYPHQILSSCPIDLIVQLNPEFNQKPSDLFFKFLAPELQELLKKIPTRHLSKDSDLIF